MCYELLTFIKIINMCYQYYDISMCSCYSIVGSVFGSTLKQNSSDMTCKHVTLTWCRKSRLEV